MVRIRSLLAAIAVATVLYPISALGATITTNEAGMDAIFGVAGLNIDIMFNPSVTVIGPAVLNNVADEAAIHALAPVAPANTVFMFFIDLISWCDTTNPAFAGCALLPGDKMIIQSSASAGANGVELNSHELGHNLALEHSDPNAANLMFSMLNRHTTRTGGQQTTILASPLVQGPVNGRFIKITPILVVPEPQTLALFAIGLTVLAGARRRR